MNEKRLNLFKKLKSDNSDLFNAWYESCLKIGNLQKLEDIFKRPINRVNEWILILNDLISASKEATHTSNYERLIETRNRYKDFQKHIREQADEYNGNTMYNFSLTPNEIIQSYDNAICSPKHDQPQVVVYPPLNDAIPYTDSFAANTYGSLQSRRSLSVASTSSSHYSSNNGSVDLKDHSNKENICKDSVFQPPQLTLNDHIHKFKHIHKKLKILVGLIGNLDFHAVLDFNLRLGKTWKKMLDFDHPHDSHDTKYSRYMDTILKLKEQETILKLTDLETTVLLPLARMGKYCEVVKLRLKDLKSLKKDYMIYLQERKTKIHDVKRDVIGKHFENMQRQLTDELPIFIDLFHRIFEVVVINYSQVMLKYLETMSGGEADLSQDVSSLQKKNFDILEAFSESRYNTKRAIRENWSFPGDPSGSRVVRKLFEL